MISIETKENCTIFKVTGEVTANDIILQASGYLTGEQTDTSIWDFTQTKRVRITTMEMHGIADSLKAVASDKKKRKVALVGSSNVNIGLGKIFAAFAQMANLPNHYKVFRSLALAEKWLSDKPRA